MISSKRHLGTKLAGAIACIAALALLTLPATPAPAAINYVIEISVDGLGGTYLQKLFNGTATGGPYSIPNFNRLKNEGREHAGRAL